MQNNEQDVTILVISETGCGKSANGNAFLQIDDAFETNSIPDSCTFVTSSKYNVINGIRRHYIDTQGFGSSDGLDEGYIQQMVEFLKSWKLGVNAFFILLNIHSPKFNTDVQHMIRLIHEFFHNSEFWNQTGIIFTKCFHGYFNREMAENEYRQKVIDFIRTFPECKDLNPQMPCFFVDSVNWRRDEDTKFEYMRLFEFAHKHKPLPTQGLQIVTPDYKSKDEEILSRVLIKEEYVGEGAHKKKIFYYQDQKRYKITDWKDQIHYTEPKMIREWTEEKKTKIKTEYKVETNKERKEIFKTEKYGRRRYGIAGPKKTREVHDYYIDTTYYTKYQRNITIDPDGNYQNGDWFAIKNWSDSKRV